MGTPLFNICRRSGGSYIKLSDPEPEFMTAVVFGTTSLSLRLNCVCAAPAQTNKETCCHHIKHHFNVSDFIAGIKAPAGMKSLTCSCYNIHQRQSRGLARG